MILTKDDVSASDGQVEKLTGEFSIHYRDCIESLIYLLSTRVYLSFSVHQLEFFLANPGKVHVDGLVHLLRYIRENKTLGLNHYADTKDETLSDLSRQASIKTENQLMVLSGYIWQYFPDTGVSAG